MGVTKVYVVACYDCTLGVFSSKALAEEAMKKDFDYELEKWLEVHVLDSTQGELYNE